LLPNTITCPVKPCVPVYAKNGFLGTIVFKLKFEIFKLVDSFTAGALLATLFIISVKILEASEEFVDAIIGIQTYNIGYQLNKLFQIGFWIYGMGRSTRRCPSSSK
jgi:hypothetical protein